MRYDDFNDEPDEEMAHVEKEEANPCPNHKRLTKAMLDVVCDMISYGVAMDQVTAWCGLPEKVLMSRHGKAVKAAQAEKNAIVAKTLHDMAISGDSRAAIFWAKSRMGWTDQPKQRDQQAEPPKKIVLVAEKKNKLQLIDTMAVDAEYEEMKGEKDAEH